MFLSDPCDNPEIRIPALEECIQGNLDSEYPGVAILNCNSPRNMWYVLYFLPLEMHILRYCVYYPLHFFPDHR
jgi:hypothetical protein